MNYTEVYNMLYKQARLNPAGLLRLLGRGSKAVKATKPKLDINKILNAAGKTPAPLELDKSWFWKRRNILNPLDNADYIDIISRDVDTNHMFSKVRPQLKEIIFNALTKNDHVYPTGNIPLTQQGFRLGNIMAQLSGTTDGILQTGGAKDGASAIQKALEKMIKEKSPFLK